MKKSDINPLPEYFDRYINLVADVELDEAFAQSVRQIEDFDCESLERLGSKVYAPGKWTVKTAIQHLTDMERVLSCRALLFARGDHAGAPPGVDENLIALNSNADRRTSADLIGELKAVRLASKSLFAGFDDRMLLQTGINWKYEMSVLALGFTLVGHQLHHFKIFEEKYFPLA